MSGSSKMLDGYQMLLVVRAFTTTNLLYNVSFLVTPNVKKFKFFEF